MQVSISANRNNEGYGVRPIELNNSSADGHLIFEVENVKDLTGEEVRAFNNKLDAILKQDDSGYSGLILTDGDYTFEIFETQTFNDLEERPYGQIDSETILVNDIENLTSEKENILFGRLQVLSNGAKGWQLFVKDNDSQLKFVPSENGSYISGPNGERIKAKIAIDSKLSSNEAAELSALLTNLEKSKNYRLSAADKYNQLVVERKRLLKTLSEQDPVIVNLDQQLEGLRKAAFGDGETVPFAVVEEVPVFLGCEGEEDKRACFQKNMQRHISKNFRYPQEAQEKGIQGRVTIMFTISETGAINNIRLRGPHQLLEAEAERIISRLPEMKPGKHKGKIVNVPFSIPITFRLEGDKSLFPSKLDGGAEPLVMVDGEESTKAVMDKINPNEIASVYILKDDAAYNKYGEKGKNGVVEINTKENGIVVSALSNTDTLKTLKFQGDKSEFPLMSDDGAAPLIMLDGKGSFKEVMSSINPKNIESINVLKGESAFNIYGEKGKNGVIVVTTKKNQNDAEEYNEEVYRADTTTMSVTATATNKNGTKIISGTVTDGMMCLPGATIGIQGSERGVISDFDGNFSIKARKGDTIILQYIGLPILKLTITDEENYQMTKKK